MSDTMLLAARISMLQKIVRICGRKLTTSARTRLYSLRMGQPTIPHYHVPPLRTSQPPVGAETSIVLRLVYHYSLRQMSAAHQ